MINQKKRQKNKGTSGITLIALVITVIVLLLLAGVSITMLTGNNNLVTQAGKARKDTGRADVIEETRIDIMGVQTENKGSLSWDNLKEVLSKHFKPEKIPAEQPENMSEVTLETSDGKYSIPLTEIYSGSLGGSTTGGEPTTLPSTKGTKPYYPTDEYTQVLGTNLETGLVIQDKDGNQYVWIEVPNDGGEGTPDYTAYKASNNVADIENALHTYTNTYRNGTSYKDEYYSDDVTGLTQSKYKELKEKMLKSIYENGGFYIGRYETGIEIAEGFRDYGIDYTIEHTITQKPVIKANAYPYNWVRCKQAQSLITTQFQPKVGEYTASLMFGVQWDLVMKYLETKGVTQNELKTDSTNWGNYNNTTYNIQDVNIKYSSNGGESWSFAPYNKSSAGSVLLTTGASDNFSKQNIYDVAGNVREWTLEYTSDPSFPCADRGGIFGFVGSSSPASTRNYNTTTNSHYNLGFRVSLY